MSENYKILDISWGTVFKIFFGVLLFGFIYLSKEIALWLFFALAVSVLMEPAIQFLRKFWIPKMAAVLLVYLSIFGILGLMIYISAPIFVSEMKVFLQFLPEYFEDISPLLTQLGIDTAQSLDGLAENIYLNLQESSKGILEAITVFFGGLMAALFILTVAFFLSLEDNAVEKFLLLIFPKKFEEQIKYIFEKSQKKVAGWFGARILACIFVGLASYVVFLVFGVKYAFLLALISGFLNFIPYIGPWVTGILVALVMLVSSGSWLAILYVVIALFLVQQAENIILTPLLMKKMGDIPPVLVLVSLLLGAELFGFLGVIFAIPIFGIIYEFIKEYLEKKRLEEIETN